MNTPTIEKLALDAQLAAQKLACEQARVSEVSRVKEHRKLLDVVLQDIKSNPRLPFSAGLTNAAHYTTNAIMWLGIALKELNEANPYPESKNPASPAIEPTADGLKL